MLKQDRIHMIVSDIDGTLLRSDGTVSDYTVSVIHRAQQQGVLFAVCSGRYPEHADAALRCFGIRCPVCGNNGATIWDARTDTVLSDQTLDPGAAIQVVRTADAMGVSYLMYARKTVFAGSAAALEVTGGPLKETLRQQYGIRFLAGADAVQDGIRQGVNKFYLFDHAMTAEKKLGLMEAMQRIAAVTVTTSGFCNVEVIPEHCSKAGGLIRMAGLFGIPLAQVMAAGDYDNDVPMLQAAGLGVAMGNATDAVKRQVGCVTDSNDGDGLAKAIEKYVL